MARYDPELLDPSEDPPDRIVTIDGAEHALYAYGRGRNRRYWPAPFAEIFDAPWHIRPTRNTCLVKWVGVRHGRRGRRDRYFFGKTVEEAVAGVTSDAKGI